MPEWITWLLGGGLVTGFGIAGKLWRDMQTIRVATAEGSAKSAQFLAQAATAGTAVASEGIMKGLMATIVEREQEAHKMTAQVVKELAGVRTQNADLRERNALLVEKEGSLLKQNGDLLAQLRVQAEDHERQQTALRARLAVRTRELGKKGAVFSATDVLGDDPPELKRKYK